MSEQSIIVDPRERRLKADGVQDVTWHSTSPLQDDALVFSFRTRCGAVLRFRMRKDSTRMLHMTLGEVLGDQSGSQPSSSSGMPSPSGEPKEGHAP